MYGLVAIKWPFGLFVSFGYHHIKTPSFVVTFWGTIYCDANSHFFFFPPSKLSTCSCTWLSCFKWISIVLFFSLAVVRSHACEVDPYGMPGGCSHICLLSSNYKARTCRCRTGFILGSDGRSCKSMLFKSKSLPDSNILGYGSRWFLTCLSITTENTWTVSG